MKKLRTRLIIIVVLLGIGVGTYYYSTSYAPNTLRVRTEVIETERIPNDLSGVKIGVVSDINGDISLLRTAIKRAAEHEVDTLVILGNVFVTSPNEEEIEAYIQILSEYNPPLGKYALYSSLDYGTNIDVLNAIYTQSDVYTLSNKNIEFHNYTENYINLVGIDGKSLASDNTDIYYPSIDTDTFTITFVHNYKLMDSIPANLSDVIVSGDTLGGKVSIPFIGSIDSDYTAISPRTTKDSQIQINSQGLGLVGSKVRFNTQAELVIIELKNQP